MNLGYPNRPSDEDGAEGVGDAHSTVDTKDRITLAKGRGITVINVFFFFNKCCKTD